MRNRDIRKEFYWLKVFKDLTIDGDLICKNSIKGPVNLCVITSCSICLQEKCKGFSWFNKYSSTDNKEIDENDKEVEEPNKEHDNELTLCINCIFECVLQYHGKQNWIETNGDPVSNLKKYFDSELDNIRNEYEQRFLKLEKDLRKINQ